MAKTKSDTSGLAAALRRRLGRSCWFRHPETGAVIQGILRKGRTVEVLTGLKAISQVGTPGTVGSVRTYDFEQTVYTVPRHVKISFGPAPVVEVKKL